MIISILANKNYKNVLINTIDNNFMKKMFDSVEKFNTNIENNNFVTLSEEIEYFTIQFYLVSLICEDKKFSSRKIKVKLFFL